MEQGILLPKNMHKFYTMEKDTATLKQKKPIQYCRVNKYTAFFIIENFLLNPGSQIMGRGITKPEYWSELTLGNVEFVRQKEEITDFRLRLKHNTDNGKDPLNT